MGRVAQYGGGDASTAGTGEQPGVRLVLTDDLDTSGNERPDLFDKRDLPGPFALGAFVDQAAGAWSGLSADRPGPRVGVDIADPNTGHLADAGGGGRGEGDDLAPAGELTPGARDQCDGEPGQRVPVGRS